jgi:uncharacterized lipoprotein YddW (UPF0748 family)
MKRTLLAAVLLGSLGIAAEAHPAPAPVSEVRAIWVTRFEYQTESEVKAILLNCASLGFNTVLFQVRGQADAYYRSRLEPWADRLGGRDPGFDPLEVACREARRLGLSLHAWLNVMPAWKGITPPSDRTHVALRHPDWIVVGRSGRRQPLNDHYLCLNPCLPAVRDHVTSVCRDIASRYPVDGLHLDYIRFIEGDWSYDEKTLALFRQKTGARPEDRPEEWTAFRRAAVTELVGMIRRAVQEERPEAILSAAVFPTAKARWGIHQDAAGWVKSGLVDWVFPMTYTDSDADFRLEIEEGYQLFPGSAAPSAASRSTALGGRGSSGPLRPRGVCFPGVGAYKHASGSQTVRQMELCRAGFALFSYSSLFVSPDEARRENAELCRARREAVRSFLAR